MKLLGENSLKKLLELFNKKYTNINYLNIPVVESEYVNDANISFQKIGGIIYLSIESLYVIKTIQKTVLFGLTNSSQNIDNFYVCDTEFILFSDDAQCRPINATVQCADGVEFYLQNRGQTIEPGVYKTNGNIVLLTNPIKI